MTWVAVGAAAVTVVGGYVSAKSNQKAAAKNVASADAAADPYAPYRDQAAQQLNKLMADPTSIESTPEYKSRMDAAGRTMAAQGYTGSGNALAAAAQAGGDVYQQAFNNLALASGAGTAPGAGAMEGANILTNSNTATSNAIGGAVNSGLYFGQKALGNWNTGANDIPPIPVDTSDSTYASNLPISFDT